MNFFGWDSDLYILHVYLRGENSSRNDLGDDLCPFDKLFNLLSSTSRDGSGILLTGDLNAHCGNGKNEFLLVEDAHNYFQHCFNNLYSVDSFFSNLYRPEDFDFYDISLKR